MNDTATDNGIARLVLMNASFWGARSRDTDTCTDVTDTNNQWVYSVVYHIANDAWPDAHCIIAL